MHTYAHAHTHTTMHILVQLGLHPFFLSFSVSFKKIKEINSTLSTTCLLEEGWMDGYGVTISVYRYLSFHLHTFKREDTCMHVFMPLKCVRCIERGRDGDNWIRMGLPMEPKPKPSQSKTSLIFLFLFAQSLVLPLAWAPIPLCPTFIHVPTQHGSIVFFS